MSTLQEKTTVKNLVSDIIVDVVWANISKKYFGRSRSWIYHKFEGRDSKGGFTEDERLNLKEALKDLAKRIDACAEKL